MKISYWNVNKNIFLNNKNDICKYIKYLSHKKVDVICLQNVYSWKSGIIFYIIYLFLLKRIHDERIINIIKYFMFIEGIILPLLTIDETLIYIEIAKYYNYNYSFKSQVSNYYKNNGCLILSRHKISDKKEVFLINDIFNKVAYLKCTINGINIINSNIDLNSRMNELFDRTIISNESIFKYPKFIFLFSSSISYRNTNFYKKIKKNNILDINLENSNNYLLVKLLKINKISLVDNILYIIDI